MPRPMVVGNWKMNTSVSEGVSLAKQIRTALDPMPPVEVVLCPPFVSLHAVSEVMEGSPVSIGAQNMHHEEKGAYTGEVSALMLLSICQYVILGHSERRQYFGETDEMINLKVKAALSAGIRPILCVGETMAQRESGDADAVIDTQVSAGLMDITDISELVVAYEPVWAIGSGVAATPEIAREVIAGTIFESLARAHGKAAASDVPLLYGGSVTAENAAQFASIEGVHGSLCGGSSLRADEFAEIANVTAQVARR